MRKSNDTKRDNDRTRWSKAVQITLLAVAALGLGGCAATVSAAVPVWEIDGYAVVEASMVPVEIEAYPRVYFEGRYAYLVDGLWYYPSSHGWVVFREEPQELSRWRTRIYSEPQRYREHEYGYPQEQKRYREPQ